MIGLAVSAVALVVAFNRIHWERLGDALRTANYVWLIPSAIVLLAAIGARAERWRWLLGARDRVSWARSFRAISMGYLTTNLLPFRLGEVVRSVVVSRNSRVSALQALSTVVVEHVLDILVVLAILALLLPGLPLPESVTQGARLSAIVFGGAAVAITVVVWQRDRVEQVARWALHHVPGLHPDAWLRRFHAAMDGLGVIRSPRPFAISGLWSVAAWLISAVSFHLALLGFTPQAPFAASLFVTITSTLVLLVPSSPGYIGVIEVAIKESLVVFGVPGEVGLAYAIVFHVMEVVVMNIAGAVGFIREGMTWSAMVSTMRAAEQRHEAPPATMESG